MNVSNAVSIYLDQRPVYIINSSSEFIEVATAEAARCLGISSEEFAEIAPPRILKKINKAFSGVFLSHALKQIVERLFQRKSVIEFDLILKLNSIIYSLTDHITQELSSAHIFSYKQVVDKSRRLSLLKREAETCYLSNTENYIRRIKMELSLWDFSQISSFDQQLISQFFGELKESHNIEGLITLKENTKAYSEYYINLFNTAKSNFNKAHPTFFSSDQSRFYTQLHGVLLNAMASELESTSKDSNNYLDIKKSSILKAIFYFKMRAYFSNEYETKLTNQNRAIGFLKKLLQVKINGHTYLIKHFESYLKDIDTTPFQDLVKQEEDYIYSLKIERKELKNKLITNSDNDWLKSEKNTFSFDGDAIDTLKSILETLPTSHFEEKFIKQLKVLYGYDFLYPEKRTSFLEPDINLNIDNDAKAIKKLVKIFESHDQECLKKTISIEEIDS